MEESFLMIAFWLAMLQFMLLLDVVIIAVVSCLGAATWIARAV